MKNWKLVCSNSNEIRIQIIKTILEISDIQVMVISKKDTVYNNFGEIEIYVRPQNVLTALDIIHEENRL